MLWGAFNNASSAMQAMDWAMGSISQNIANVNTTGYKKKETEFKTVLSEGHSSPAGSNNSPTQATATTGLNVFGVRAVDRYAITQQGMMTGTTNWTDLGINGRGFFMVAQAGSDGGPPTSVSLTDDTSVLYTRAGNFQTYGQHTATALDPPKGVATSSSDPATGPGEADKTYFRTGSGQFLLGWMADAQGRIQGKTTTATSPVPVANSATAGAPQTLVPIYTTPGKQIDGIATTTIQPVVNLPADAQVTAINQTFTKTAWVTHPVSVTDASGVVTTSNKSFDLTTNWTRTGEDTWSLSYNLPSAANATLSPSTIQVKLTADANGNMTATNITTATPPAVTDPTLQDIAITWNSEPLSATNPSTSTIYLNSPPTGQQKVNLPTVNEIPLVLTIYDENFEAHNLPVFFEKQSTGNWNMRIHPSNDYTVTALGSTTGTATGAAAAGLATSVPITFDGGAKVTSPTSVNFSITWTPSVTPVAPAAVPVPSEFSAPTAAAALLKSAASVTAPTLPATETELTAYQTALTNAMTVNPATKVPTTTPAEDAAVLAYATALGSAMTAASAATATAKAAAAAKAGSNTVTMDASKLTQYVGNKPGNIDIKSLDQDGYESGVMDSTSFNARGELIAHFSNGRTRTLAMVPLATFTAADQLNPISGTVFRRTDGAGKMTVDDISSQGSGYQIVASAVEASNVDLTDEFSRMIVTQKAYSMNATVFKTADEMTTTARDLYK
jgi:flagellar hook protein FlgE